MENADSAKKVGCITLVLTFHFQHKSPPTAAIVEGHRKIKNQSAPGEKGIEPNSARVCHAGVDEDRVAGAGIELSSVSMRYLDLPEVCKVLAGARGEISVNLDARYVAGSSYDFSHNRCVVADAAANVQNAIPLGKVEGVNTEGEVARLSVVQMAARVNRYQNVVAQAPGISVLCGSIVFVPVALNLPWPRPKKTLARNFSERVYQRL
jgi:hypothetical protein